MKKTIVVGVTSGIAAYKSLELVRLLKQSGCNIFVIMTKNATKMISKKEFEDASGNPVSCELFQEHFDYKKVLEKRRVDHIALADKADVMVIAPATANTIAKIAHGMADDFLTTTVLALTAPLIICPSMNVNMWNNPAVQENVAKLKNAGHVIIEPSCGRLACGYDGKGRLKDVMIIRDEVLEQLNRGSSLQGKKIIVTTGGTREKIDAVRFITNRSSGKMGVAIAEECYNRGADVLLLRAENSVAPRFLLRQKLFSTAAELLDLVKKNGADADVFYHAAAVSDFAVEESFSGKISSKEKHTLTLKPQPKILDEVKKLNPRVRLIAFKAEHGLSEKELIEVAKKRLQECEADAIIANDVSKSDGGFESDMNEVTVVLAAGGTHHFSLAPKKIIAQKIIDVLEATVK